MWRDATGLLCDKRKKVPLKFYKTVVRRTNPRVWGGTLNTKEGIKRKIAKIRKSRGVCGATRLEIT